MFSHPHNKTRPQAGAALRAGEKHRKLVDEITCGGSTTVARSVDTLRKVAVLQAESTDKIVQLLGLHG